MKDQYLATLAYDRTSSIQRLAEQKVKYQQEQFRQMNDFLDSKAGSLPKKIGDAASPKQQLVDTMSNF